MKQRQVVEEAPDVSGRGGSRALITSARKLPTAKYGMGLAGETVKPINARRRSEKELSPSALGPREGECAGPGGMTPVPKIPRTTRAARSDAPGSATQSGVSGS